MVNNFKKQSKYKKASNFFSAKTIRYMLIKEYYNNELNFPIVMLKKLNAVEEVSLKQYSEMKDEIELNKALRELECYGVPNIA